MQATFHESGFVLTRILLSLKSSKYALIILLSYQEFIEEFLHSDATFEENNKFGFVSGPSRKKEKDQEDAGMQGLGGTFKKLDI